MKLLKKIFLKLFYFLIFLFFTDIIIIIIYLYSVNNFEKKCNCSSQSDLGVTFNYGYYPSGHSPENRQRIELINDLYHKKIIKRIFCVGGCLKKEKKNNHSEKIRDTLLYLGIMENWVFADSVSYDTYSNLEEVVNFVNFNKIKNILLTSSPFHLFRINKINNQKNYLQATFCTYPVIKYFEVYNLYEFFIETNYEIIKFFLLWLPDKLYPHLLKIKQKYLDRN